MHQDVCVSKCRSKNGQESRDTDLSLCSGEIASGDLKISETAVASGILLCLRTKDNPARGCKYEYMQIHSWSSAHKSYSCSARPNLTHWKNTTKDRNDAYKRCALDTVTSVTKHHAHACVPLPQPENVSNLNALPKVASTVALEKRGHLMKSQLLGLQTLPHRVQSAAPEAKSVAGTLTPNGLFHKTDQLVYIKLIEICTR